MNFSSKIHNFSKKHANRASFHSFSIQNDFFQAFILITQFQREKRPLLVNQSQENPVAFPRWKFKKPLFLNPFEVAFVAVGLLAFPFGADEDVHLLGGPDVVDEGDDATIPPRGDGKARFFKDFAPHAVLGAFAFLELAAHANPFVVVLVVLLLGAVQHEVLAAALQVTLGGLFHTTKIHIFQILRILRNGFCVIFLEM